MPVSFQSGGSGVEFSALGLTQSLVGITLITTLYNSGTGQTTSTSIVPTSLNYILGGDFSATVIGATYQTPGNATLSLTTNASRMVQISVVGFNTGGYFSFNTPTTTTNEGFVRVLRGPSTVIETVSFKDTGSDLVRLPSSGFVFHDFSPISGSATYLLQVTSAGASGIVIPNNVKLLVRQI